MRTTVQLQPPRPICLVPLEAIKVNDLFLLLYELTTGKTHRYISLFLFCSSCTLSCPRTLFFFVIYYICSSFPFLDSRNYVKKWECTYLLVQDAFKLQWLNSNNEITSKLVRYLCVIAHQNLLLMLESWSSLSSVTSWIHLFIDHSQSQLLLVHQLCMNCNLVQKL
jgi:hypothetical protein